MMKKHISTLSAIACAVAGLVVFSCAGEKKTTKEVSLKAIPAGSMLIARIENPEDVAAVMRSSLCVRAFDSLSIGEALHGGFGLLHRLCGPLSAQQPVSVGASKVGAKNISLIFVAATGKDFRLPTFGKDTLVSTDRYEKTDITTIRTPSATYSYYTEDDNLVLSDDRLYLEQSILQQASGASLASDKSFAKAYPVLFAGKKAAVALRLPAIEDYAVKTLGFEDTGLIGSLAPWAALELKADSTSLTADGIFCADDSIATLASVLAAQKVKELTLDDYFPSDASAYTYFGISDWPSYFDDYTRYLKASSQFHLYNTAAQRYNKIFDGDFRDFFLPWAGTGFAVVRTAGSLQDNLIVGVKDASAASLALEKIADSSAVRPDPYQDCAIVPIGQKTVFYDLVTRTAGRPGVAFGAVMGEVAVFSPTLEALQKIIDDIREGTTLPSVLPYAQHKEKLATNTNLLMMGRGDLWSTDIAKVAAEKRREGRPLSDLERYVRTNTKTLKNLRYNFLQVSATGGTAFVTLGLWWDDSAPRQAVKEWSYKLENAPATAPLPFPNHRNGRFDILVQDTGGILYLLSDKGSLFWKKKLPGAITSSIVVCDLYDNKKYQMAFWTGKKFHVIDRLGKDVREPDKIARAKKQQPPKPSASVASTNEIGLLKSGAMKKIKTEQSPLSGVVYIASNNVLVYRVADGKIYGITPEGEKLQGFPVTAEMDFTAEDFGRNKRLGIVTSSPDGTLALYRMPQTADKP